MDNTDKTEHIRHERDQYRILVDITNSVLSHLEMDGLVAEVSREIHRFFGLSQISIALCDNTVLLYIFVIPAITRPANPQKRHYIIWMNCILIWHRFWTVTSRCA